MATILETKEWIMTAATTRHTHIKLKICAFLEYLSLVRHSVRTVADNIGMNIEQAEAVTLAVQEALTNVIKHSYGGPCNEKIIIRISELQGPKFPNGAMEISIRDYGKAVDPEKIIGRNLDDIKPGGLGVHIIKSIMDQSNYFKMADKGMELTMIKIVNKDTSVKASCPH
ncbi:MAG: ATP-binding protein [Phycisphaerae bacterium]|nr:ATP-binding protein [Phycisphaerae bacterium]